MRKKIPFIFIAAICLLALSIGAASPSFVPVDPDQPIRPLLLEDQTLKENYQSVLQDSTLASHGRSLELNRLSESYADLAAHARKMQNEGIAHPILPSLETYFSDLSIALSTMADAFEQTDPILLAQANESLKTLDENFQSMQQN